MPALIVLSGGKGTRIKRDKAFLRINNKFLIEIILDTLTGLFDEIIIVANKNIDRYSSITKKYKKNNKKIIVTQDMIKDKGPLAGVYTGLKESKEKNSFVLACDMPFINKKLISYMLKFKDYDAVVPKINNGLEPLHAVYSRNILPLIKDQLGKNQLKITDALKKFKKVRYLNKKEIERFDKKCSCFFNINDKEDYKKARKELGMKIRSKGVFYRQVMNFRP